MDHVAIMKPSWRLIPKILSGEKTIESRWYQTRRAPWNNIRAGDRVYFKDSGKYITAVATVSEVLQFTLNRLADAEQVVERYGKHLSLVNRDPSTWSSIPKYCILIRLIDAKPISQPFAINKQGFGSAAAWITVPSISNIRL